MSTIKSSDILNKLVEKITTDPKCVNVLKKIRNGYDNISVVIPALYGSKVKIEEDKELFIEIEEIYKCRVEFFDDFEEGEDTNTLNTIYKSFVFEITNEPSHKEKCRIWFKIV